MNEITHLSVYVMEDPTGIARQSAEIIEKLCKEALAERGVFNIAIERERVLRFGGLRRKRDK